MKHLLLDSIYGFLHTAIICIDPEERVQYLNVAALSELACGHENVIGKYCSDLFVKAPAENGEDIWRFAPSGKVVEFRDGGEHSPSGIPVMSRLDIEGCYGWKIVQLNGLGEQVYPFEELFENSGSFWLDKHHFRVISGTLGWSELFSGEIPGGLDALNGENQPGAGASMIRQALEDQRVQFQRRSVKAKEYWVMVYPLPGKEPEGGLLVVYIGLTRFKEVQTQLLQAICRAENANKAKRFFLANMSHELRTPLNAVIGYSELLQEGRHEPEKVKECLDGINFAGNALLRLINNILDLSKLEARQMTFVPKLTDICSMIMELKAVFKHTCEKHGIEQLVDIQPDLPILMLDELRLRQILLNLIGNACKFTQNGFLKIVVRYTRQPGSETGTLLIDIEDNGCGIPKEKQEAVFSPFTQEEAMSHPHIFKGTGLGLAISREMVRCMGGRIELESEVGQGSIFSVILENVAAAQPRNIPEHAEPEELSQEFLSSLEVLLIDDVPINLKILSAMCGSLGIRNRTALSAEEALETMSALKPGLVMTDMWMPGMSGAELLVKMRQDEGLADIPVVIVTADVEAGEMRGLDQFDALLFKPISKEKLRHVLLELYHQKFMKRS